MSLSEQTYWNDSWKGSFCILPYDDAQTLTLPYPIWISKPNWSNFFDFFFLLQYSMITIRTVNLKLIFSWKYQHQIERQHQKEIIQRSPSIPVVKQNTLRTPGNTTYCWLSCSKVPVSTHFYPNMSRVELCPRYMRLHSLPVRRSDSFRDGWKISLLQSTQMWEEEEGKIERKKWKEENKRNENMKKVIIF